MQFNGILRFKLNIRNSQRIWKYIKKTKDPFEFRELRRIGSGKQKSEWCVLKVKKI